MIQLIQEEKELLNNITKYSKLITSFGQYEHSLISIKILNKMISVQEKLILQPDNLLLSYSSLRYVFETLIHTRLMLLESNYVYKIFYFVYVHQVEKTERLIVRIKKEIELIEKYVKLEEEGLKKISTLNKTRDEDQIKKILKEIKDQENIFDEEAGKEITMFFGDYKFNGFPYQKIIMEKNLEAFKNKLEELKSLKTNKAKEILNDSRINQYFNFSNQHSKVFTELKESRSWEEKAKIAGLKDEYKQMYELSSAILHSTSYSLMTSVDADEGEKQFSKDLITRYSKDILNKIKKMLDLEKLMKINFIEI
ncbi:hypothetical protein ACHRV1_07545 [Flavobacterium aquidurense]|uniref:hypothetical protein n=1 Tax=Flavobacterium aquidurense TaxID=362413 RepID=UPI00375712AB